MRRSGPSEEGAERLLRFLFTWDDYAVDQDWQSALSGRWSCDDLVRRYVALRRAAPGFRRRLIDHHCRGSALGSDLGNPSCPYNHHRGIPAGDTVTLLEDARWLDTGDESASWSPDSRIKVECSVCGGVYRALRRRNPAYCSESCKQKAKRNRRGAQIDTISVSELPSDLRKQVGGLRA